MLDRRCGGSNRVGKKGCHYNEGKLKKSCFEKNAFKVSKTAPVLSGAALP